MVFQKVLVALMGLWSVSAWAADPWCSARENRVHSFAWTATDKAEPRLGTVHVKHVDSGKTVQVIPNVENYHDDSDAFRFTDFNNDRCPDLLVTSSVAGIGNESNTVFLYDRKRRKFVLSKTLSEIGGLNIDRRDKNCVTGFWKGGAADFYTSKHCWRNGRLVIKREYSVGPVVNADGEQQCYQHITTEYHGGKKKVKKRCTQEF